jgi:endonuclease/exonuclease/phosphatase family metal-dependent hydrolase
MTVRFGTYNLHCYGQDNSNSDQRMRLQQDRLIRVIRALDADVLAVQEIVSYTVDDAASQLRELAEAVSMDCVAEQCSWDRTSSVAVAPAATGYCVGLMWRPGIAPVPGGWRAYGAADFSHALATVVLDVGGPTPVRFAAYHADPFRPHRRFDEAYRVVSVFQDGRPGLVGADWNNISADRRRSNGSYYDDDPCLGQAWHPDMLRHVRWSDDPDAVHETDRRPAELLRRGGLFDAAAVLEADWQATYGYTPGKEPLLPRRIDAIRVTHQVLPQLESHQVVRTPDTLAASDHLPVVVEFKPTVKSTERSCTAIRMS